MSLIKGLLHRANAALEHHTASTADENSETLANIFLSDSVQSSSDALSSSLQRTIGQIGGRERSLSPNKSSNRSPNKSPTAGKPIKSLFADMNHPRVIKYRKLQATSHSYMHLVESEARNLLEMQQKVMKASLRLEQLRQQHGGHITGKSALNSAGPTQEDEVRKSAGQKRRIANLEKQVQNSNTIMSKELHRQSQMKLDIEEGRHKMMSRKTRVRLLTDDLDEMRRQIGISRAQLNQEKTSCMQLKKTMMEMNNRDQGEASELAALLRNIDRRKRRAQTEFRHSTTHLKQEVEAARRKKNLTLLASKRPATATPAGNRGKPMGEGSNGQGKPAAPVPVRPATAAARPTNGKKRSAGRRVVIVEDENVKSKTRAQTAQPKRTPNYAKDSRLRQRHSRRSIRQLRGLSRLEREELQQDPTLNPDKWIPGAPQTREDPSADKSPQSRLIPAPLGRRGNLVGRAPGRFTHAKISGRLELLLSKLPQVAEDKKAIKKKSIASMWQLARQKNSNTRIHASIDEMEKAFERIQKESGVSSIDEFVDIFIAAEKRQYRVVKQVDDMEQQLVQVRKKSVEIQKEIQDIQNLAQTSEKHGKDGLFNKLQSELASIAQRQRVYEANLDDSRMHLQAICGEVERLVATTEQPQARELLQVSKSNPSESAGAHGGVNSLNLPRIIGILEDRVCHLANLQAAIRMPEEERLRKTRELMETKKAREQKEQEKQGADVPAKMVGGELSVTQQLERKFKNSPRWVFKMAVEMHENMTIKGSEGSAGDDEKREPVQATTMPQSAQPRLTVRLPRDEEIEAAIAEDDEASTRPMSKSGLVNDAKQLADLRESISEFLGIQKKTRNDLVDQKMATLASKPKARYNGTDMRATRKYKLHMSKREKRELKKREALLQAEKEKEKQKPSKSKKSGAVTTGR